MHECSVLLAAAGADSSDGRHKSQACPDHRVLTAICTACRFVVHARLTTEAEPKSEQCSEDERLLPRIRAMLDSGPEPPKKRGKSCYIAWDYMLEPGGATTYFAFSPPYTYADLQGYLKRLEQFFMQPTQGKSLPAYMDSIEIHGGGSGTLASRTTSPVKPKKVKVTIEHGAVDNRKMTLWLRKDSTMLQVRQGIVEALGLTRLSQVKLVRRMPNSERLMTPFGDTERLNQRTHLLMVGYEFPDGFAGPEPEAAQETQAPEPALPVLNSSEESWNPICGAQIYFHRQRLCLTREGRRVDLITLSESMSPNAKVCVETSPESCLERSAFLQAACNRTLLSAVIQFPPSASGLNRHEFSPFSCDSASVQVS